MASFTPLQASQHRRVFDLHSETGLDLDLDELILALQCYGPRLQTKTARNLLQRFGKPRQPAGTKRWLMVGSDSRAGQPGQSTRNDGSPRHSPHVSLTGDALTRDLALDFPSFLEVLEHFTKEILPQRNRELQDALNRLFRLKPKISLSLIQQVLSAPTGDIPDPDAPIQAHEDADRDNGQLDPEQLRTLVEMLAPGAGGFDFGEATLSRSNIESVVSQNMIAESLKVTGARPPMHLKEGPHGRLFFRIYGLYNVKEYCRTKHRGQSTGIEFQTLDPMVVIRIGNSMVSTTVVTGETSPEWPQGLVLGFTIPCTLLMEVQEWTEAHRVWFDLFDFQLGGVVPHLEWLAGGSLPLSHVLRSSIVTRMYRVPLHGGVQFPMELDVTIRCNTTTDSPLAELFRCPDHYWLSQEQLQHAAFRKELEKGLRRFVTTNAKRPDSAHHSANENGGSVEAAKARRLPAIGRLDSSSVRPLYNYTRALYRWLSKHLPRRMFRIMAPDEDNQFRLLPCFVAPLSLPHPTDAPNLRLVTGTQRESAKRWTPLLLAQNVARLPVRPFEIPCQVGPNSRAHGAKLEDSHELLNDHHQLLDDDFDDDAEDDTMAPSVPSSGQSDLLVPSPPSKADGQELHRLSVTTAPSTMAKEQRSLRSDESSRLRRALTSHEERKAEESKEVKSAEVRPARRSMSGGVNPLPPVAKRPESRDKPTRTRFFRSSTTFRAKGAIEPQHKANIQATNTDFGQQAPPVISGMTREDKIRKARAQQLVKLLYSVDRDQDAEGLHPGYQLASPFTCLTRGYASEWEHALFLCSAMLGLREDAYVCVGEDELEVRYWVICIRPTSNTRSRAEQQPQPALAPQGTSNANNDGNDDSEKDVGLWFNVKEKEVVVVHWDSTSGAFCKQPTWVTVSRTRMSAKDTPRNSAVSSVGGMVFPPAKQANMLTISVGDEDSDSSHEDESGEQEKESVWEDEENGGDGFEIPFESIPFARVHTVFNHKNLFFNIQPQSRDAVSLTSWDFEDSSNWLPFTSSQEPTSRDGQSVAAQSAPSPYVGLVFHYAYDVRQLHTTVDIVRLRDQTRKQEDTLLSLDKDRKRPSTGLTLGAPSVKPVTARERSVLLTSRLVSLIQKYRKDSLFVPVTFFHRPTCIAVASVLNEPGVEESIGLLCRAKLRVREHHVAKSRKETLQKARSVAGRKRSLRNGPKHKRTSTRIITETVEKSSDTDRSESKAKSPNKIQNSVGGAALMKRLQAAGRSGARSTWAGASAAAPTVESPAKLKVDAFPFGAESKGNRPSMSFNARRSFISQFSNSGQASPNSPRVRALGSPHGHTHAGVSPRPPKSDSKQEEPLEVKLNRATSQVAPPSSISYGRPFHFSTDDCELVFRQLQWSGILDCSVPGAMYVVGARVINYPWGLQSVWVYIGYIFNISDVT